MVTRGPSKQFIIRGAVATAILALILIVQTAWFKGLFSKKTPGKIAIDPNTTIGDVVNKDSNGNGISDWEERLWGLDPTKLYTDGVPNKTIIEQKQKALGVPADGTPDAGDKLARDLYALAISLGADTAIDSPTLQSVAASLANNVAITAVDNTYASGDIKTTKTTFAALSSYKTTLAKVLTPYQDTAPGIEIVITALDTGDYSQLPKLSDAVAQYAAAAKAMKGVTVPIGVLQNHLDIMNGLAGMSKAFVYLENLDENGLDALSGLALYKNYNALFVNATQNLNHYLVRYGILTS